LNWQHFIKIYLNRNLKIVNNEFKDKTRISDFSVKISNLPRGNYSREDIDEIFKQYFNYLKVKKDNKLKVFKIII